MKVLVSDDVHIYKLPDGTFWSNAINDYNFYKRYLESFDSVKLVGRMKEVDELPGKCLRLDGPGIDIYGIPFFQGPLQLIKVIIKVLLSLRGVSKDCDVAILRIPSITSFLTFYNLKKLSLGVEVVYDPYNDINDSKSKLNIFIWTIISKIMKQCCRKANGVSYVTRYSIQKNIPSSARLFGEDMNHFESYYSSISLPDDTFAKEHRTYKKGQPFLISISDVAMNNDRKGESVFIKVIHDARKRGHDVRGIIIGDGSLKNQYIRMTKDLGVDMYIEFTGLFASPMEVREKIRCSDLLLLPTKAEGLPISILEAMAEALPVLSTPVGGIPEIIESEYLFDPLDVEGFTNKLCTLLDNPKELEIMSIKNLEKSKEYMNSLLQMRRRDFYSKLANIAKINHSL